MRGLAKDLGAKPVALYRHVGGREDLLKAVVAALLDGVLNDFEFGDHVLAGGPGRQGLRRTTDRGRAREGVPARSDPPPSRALAAAAATQPGLVEHFLVTLRGYGSTDQQLAATYRAFSSFLLGQLLLESASRAAQTSPVQLPLNEGEAQLPHRDGRADLSGLPEAARLRPLLSEDHSEEEFEITLENLLDRLEMDLSQ